MKIFITFGQIHVHRVNGKTFDCDCVAVIEAENEEEGRKLAFYYFDNKWCFSYPEEKFDLDEHMPYYPRGLIEVAT